jgi:CRP-like cAMP-binding protein
MIDDGGNSNISLVEREKLIHLQPCFSMLTAEETHELATIMTEATYAAGEIVVSQGELVDKVFIIGDGYAEVSERQDGEVSYIPLATLSRGESIGLSETGYFSKTGKRTANVTASTALTLLVINVENLNVFFDRYAHIPVEILANSEKMLRTNFIKQALSFENLSEEQMAWLEDHIQEAYYNAGDTIFKQGEMGDRCYLIFTGKVEIIRQDAQGVEHLLTVLTSPAFFGEATLITGMPRNATARMQEEGELLVLQHQYLAQLMEKEQAVANTMMRNIIEHSQPKQNPHVIPFQRKTADGEDIVILKNPDNDKYCQISPDGWYIWRQLNGKNTLSDLQADTSRERVIALVAKFAQGGFVELQN